MAQGKDSREQGMSGKRGAQAEQTPGVGRQPPQGSDRAPDQRHQHQRREGEHHFAPGQAPSEQGEKEHPSPHVIAEHQQGMASRPRSGNTPAHGERSTEISEAGEPREEHTRSGRHDVPGDREQNQ